MEPIIKTCRCGCGQKFTVKPGLYYKLPEYISGHNSKDYIRTEEHKKNISLALMGHLVTEETKEEIRLAKKGHKHGYKTSGNTGHNKGWCGKCGKFHRSTKGYTWTSEKSSESQKRRVSTPEGKMNIKRMQELVHTPEVIATMKDTVRKNWADPEWHAEHTKCYQTPEFRQMCGERSSANWQNSDYVRKVIKGWNIEPNKDEKELIDFFAEYFPSFQYNGNFELKVNPDGLIPDFVDIENRRIVEYFGYFRHTQEEAEKKIARYAEEGWHCLVLWPNDLKDKWTLIEKLAKFIDTYKDTVEVL